MTLPDAQIEHSQFSKVRSACTSVIEFLDATGFVLAARLARLNAEEREPLTIHEQCRSIGLRSECYEPQPLHHRAGLPYLSWSDSTPQRLT